ncbi:MAG TPA: hypothetical protein PLW69_10690 [Agitococcus sp.]|jgi:hypothetical protein|nr:hypothetical protein [Agitococcus sp.]
MIKLVAEMSLQELAAYVATHLKSRQLPVVLVGGSCVSIYSNNKYQTKDLDFVERYHNQRSLLRSALQDIGFIEQHRYFVHPDAHYFLEFPLGPLAVGDSPVNELNEVVTETGVVTLLTAQDCICDRLSAYYHWHDQQSLQQAIWVALAHPFDLAYVKSWSEREGMLAKFETFLDKLSSQQTK